MKKILAYIFFYTGVSYFLFRLRLLSTDIRVINYHCTPVYSRFQLEKQLKFYKKYFENINLVQLSDYFTTSKNRKSRKPGLIISFDDGLRSNFDNAVDILEKYNFTGWFFMPTGFLLDPSQNFAQDNSIILKQVYPDNRYGMSIDEAKYIASKHIIGCHTFTHHRMSTEDSQATLEFEIKQAKLKLEELLGIKEISCFCWVGGELQTYTAEAYKKILETGYKFIFATNNLPINQFSNIHMINRTNIEAEYSIPLVMFQLSGIIDIIYFKKRKQIIKLFSSCC